MRTNWFFRRSPFAWIAFFALATGCAAQQQSVSHGMPVASFQTTHVTLFDTGVAQLEQQADVHGEMVFSIPTTAAHLDDLVATLTVATDANVRVTGVEYESAQSLAQAIYGSGFARAMMHEENGFQRPTDLAGYIQSLTGVEVQVQKQDNAEIRGTVLDCTDVSTVPPASEVTSQTPSSSTENRAPSKVLILASEAGALLSIPLNEIVAVTPVSRREAAALRTFAAELGKAGGFAKTEVTVHTGAKSAGKLAVSYIRQAPVWRTLYKISEQTDGLVMEAWAVIHNDSMEDWENVQLTLVSGQPYSYVMPVTSPRYRHRDSLVIEESNDALTPQLGAQTADSLLYPSPLDGAGDSGQYGFGYGSGGLGLSGTGYGGGGVGEGSIGLGNYGTLERSSSLLSIGKPAAEVQTVASTEGEISVYRALHPVSIRSGASAVAPVLRQRLSGEAFVLLDDGNNARTCVRAINDTGLVLQRGAASVYLDGRFRGQTEVERTEPGEQRVWCFGEDLDVTYSTNEQVESAHHALEWSVGGRLYEHSLRTTRTVWTIENKGGTPRHVAVAESLLSNGRFVSPAQWVKGEGTFLHMLDVAQNSKQEVMVHKEEGVAQHIVATVESLKTLIDNPDVSSVNRAILTDAAEKAKSVDGVESKIQEQKTRIARLQENVQQLNGNLAAVPKLEGSSKLAESILRQIMDVEKTIVAEQQELEKLEEQKSAAEQKVSQILSGIQISQ